LAELPRPDAEYARLHDEAAAELLVRAALVGGVVPGRVRRHDGAAVVCRGGRHRTGDQRPRQPGDHRAVRGGAERGARAPGNDRARVPRRLSVSWGEARVSRPQDRRRIGTTGGRMIDLSMAQTVFDRPDSGPVLRARSANFPDDWIPEAERIGNDFG